MAEKTVHSEELGDIVIAPEVLEVIIGITTSKIEGVHALRNKRFWRLVLFLSLFGALLVALK